jgi:hypothetical protein
LGIGRGNIDKAKSPFLTDKINQQSLGHIQVIDYSVVMRAAVFLAIFTTVSLFDAGELFIELLPKVLYRGIIQGYGIVLESQGYKPILRKLGRIQAAFDIFLNYILCAALRALAA